MQNIQSTHEKTAPVPDAAHALTPALILLLATGTGLSAACLYYCQPMLGILATELGATSRSVGLVPTLTQLGYALGILLFVPLGDRHDRRTLILIKAGLLAATLLLSGLASSLPIMLATSLTIGLTATLAQDLVPAAVAMATDAQRGRVIGTVMTGLLLGILLSRVVSGLVAAHWGWRAMFVAASTSIGLLGVAAWHRLPRFTPTTALSYRALLGSMLDLWRRHPALRRATIAQGLQSVAFSAFWSTLAITLQDAPFHLGSAAAGAFGLAGAAGALAAPFAGHLADRRGPELLTRLGTGLTALSFGLMSLSPLFSTQQQLLLLGLGAIGFDLGVQTSLIAHQSIIYSIDPAARSRLNAVLIVGMFIGMALGSAAGSLLLAQWGRTAVMVMATAAALLALGVRLSQKTD
ncbi:MAG TPA: MFS transporter [Rhodocyclaceae bacterium]|nr:MFS transporter [Rhodocyclaceae bacterium]